jgi:hypothetical protein
MPSNPTPFDPTKPKCEHKWAFLRKSETYEIGYRKWFHDDIFYCEKCCEYKSVRIEHEERRSHAW